MKPLFLVPIVLLFSSCVRTQTISNTELKFTQAWVWEYENELIAKNQAGRQGEMVVYFNPELNYWLFNFEAYGASGEMFEWILGKPDGTYIFSVNDEFKTYQTQQKIEFDTTQLDLKPTAKFKYFKYFTIDFEPIKAEIFELNYLKTNDKTEISLANFEADFTALYHFNQLDSEVKLPIQFLTSLNPNQLIAEENSVVSEKRIRYKLIDVSHTEYYIQLNDGKK